MIKFEKEIEQLKTALDTTIAKARSDGYDEGYKAAIADMTSLFLTRDTTKPKPSPKPQTESDFWKRVASEGIKAIELPKIMYNVTDEKALNEFIAGLPIRKFR